MARGGRRRIVAATALALTLLAVPVATSALGSSRLTHLSGTVTVLHADRFDGSAPRDRFKLETATGLVAVEPGEHADQLMPGSRVELSGHLLDSGALSLATAAPVQTLAAAAPAALIPSQRTVAVLIVTAEGAPVPSQPGDVEAAMFSATTSVDAFYREQSAGALGFTGYVFGPWTVPAIPAGTCPDDAWMALARSLAAQNKVNLSAYQHVIVDFPKSDGCHYEAAAYVGLSPSSTQGEVFVNGPFTTRIVAHEIGHNLGLWHAAALVCHDAAGVLVPTVEPIASGCIDPETSDDVQYGDPYDVMGGAPELRQMNAVHRRAIGILPADAINVIGQLGAYTLQAIEGSAGVRALEIPFGGGRSYSIELRRPFGFDAFAPTDPAVTGVLIHRDAWSGDDLHTLLVNASAATSGDWRDAPLRVGGTFTDAPHGIAVTLLSLSASGATVGVTVTGEHNPPAAPISLTAKLVGSSSVELAWPASLDDTGIESYRVQRDGADVATVSSFESYTDNPPPIGRVYGFEETGVPGGHTYRYRVIAVDPAGNVGTPSAVAVIRVPDRSAPRPPTRLLMRRLADGRVRLSWSGASDDVGIVRYRIRRGSRVIATTRDRTFTDRPVPLGRQSIYSIVAVDAAGNASAFSSMLRISSGTRSAVVRRSALH